MYVGPGAMMLSASLSGISAAIRTPETSAWRKTTIMWVKKPTESVSGSR